MYIIAGQAGVLRGSYLRNEFEICSLKFIMKSDVYLDLTDYQLKINFFPIQSPFCGLWFHEIPVAVF